MGRPDKRKPRPFEAAAHRLRGHYLLGSVAGVVAIGERPQADRRDWPPRACLRIVGDTRIVVNESLKLREDEWLALLALAVLALALGAARRLPPSPVADLAAQLAALHWWRTLRVGELPERVEPPASLAVLGRLPLEEIAARLRASERDEAELDESWTLNGTLAFPLLVAVTPPPPTRWNPLPRAASSDPEALFAQAMVDNARRTLRAQRPGPIDAKPDGPGMRARGWLISNYPLLGGVAAQFEIVEDAEVCRRMGIAVAAIHVGTGEIYVNPARALAPAQMRFVIAHEVLHAGLNHAGRRRGRDPFLWNVACDFVINDWLVQMGVGTPPDGLLFDEALRGQSADDIYLALAADLRVRRRLATFRGDDVDLLDDAVAGRDVCDREEFCRRALAQGLDHHRSFGRGTVPDGLVEAIRTLSQPPIPWQARLAEWMRERFPAVERRRSYARPSRRQSSTPDMPRPRLLPPDIERASRTFGVVLDTSGSMDRADLGKALGAIVSYAQAHDVRSVRLVYCDARPYDEGDVPVEALAARARVRGRGGTVLQPALSLLESRRDFPRDAPILVITDGFCEDVLHVGRDHAFLLPPGGRLPFATRKPVFRMA